MPGEGAAKAAIVLVGEQPGDQEDRAGRPFVGPAGALLDRALTAVGLDRRSLFVTNAVKHFKHEPRGKRRLHKTPNVGEVRACRWWLEAELRLVRPKVTVAMGGTAAKAVLRRSVAVLRDRGEAEETEDGGRAFVTVHPSSLLREPDPIARAAAISAFSRDLERAAALAS